MAAGKEGIEVRLGLPHRIQKSFGREAGSCHFNRLETLGIIMIPKQKVRTLRCSVGALRPDPGTLQDRMAARAAWAQAILVVEGPPVTASSEMDRAGKRQDFIVGDHPALTGVCREIRIQLVQVGALGIKNLYGTEITLQIIPLSRRHLVQERLGEIGGRSRFGQSWFQQNSPFQIQFQSERGRRLAGLFRMTMQGELLALANGTPADPGVETIRASNEWALVKDQTPFGLSTLRQHQLHADYLGALPRVVNRSLTMGRAIFRAFPAIVMPGKLDACQGGHWEGS